jgi:hypothetical protein
MNWRGVRLANAPSRLAVKDPVTHNDHSVVGLRIPYITALATGKMFRSLSPQFKDRSECARSQIRSMSSPASCLAANESTRRWINAYAPGKTTPTPNFGADVVDTSNILHAADIWYSIKKIGASKPSAAAWTWRGDTRMVGWGSA